MEWFLKVVRDNYANFNGRARRKEYWMFVLVYVIISFVIGFIGGIVYLISSTFGALVFGLTYVLSLALLIPTLAVLARRLHDVGKPTWFIVLAFIPIVNLYVFYLTLLEGDKGPNEYGPDPKEADNADPFASFRPETFKNNP